MKHKALAYITRQHDGQTQLLVFKHRDFPEAGVQIPAGTVEPGEPVEAALFREIREESGVTGQQVQLVRKLAEFPDPAWGNVRHVFHLVATVDLPEHWEWLTNDYNDEEAQARDERLVFCFYWADLGVELSGRQGLWLHLIEQRNLT